MSCGTKSTRTADHFSALSTIRSIGSIIRRGSRTILRVKNMGCPWLCACGLRANAVWLGSLKMTVLIESLDHAERKDILQGGNGSSLNGEIGGSSFPSNLTAGKQGRPKAVSVAPRFGDRPMA